LILWLFFIFSGIAVAGGRSESNSAINAVNNTAQQPQTQQPVLAMMNRNDPLALATAAAASELAGSLRDIAATNLQASQDDSTSLGDYGIYGVVSKMSRKVNPTIVIVH